MKYLLSLVVTYFLVASFAYGQHYPTQEVIDEILNYEDIDKHTCKRVNDLAKGQVSEKECRSRLTEANAFCVSEIYRVVPEVSNEDDARAIVRIAMFCPVARILNMPFDATKALQ